MFKYNDPDKTPFLVEIAKCWNDLDISCIEKILADDLEYYSDWWIESMYGKDNYLYYLAEKFKSLHGQSGAKPKAAMAYEVYEWSPEKRPCLIITQKLGGTVNTMSIHVQVRDARVYYMSMTTVPSDRATLYYGLITE